VSWVAFVRRLVWAAIALGLGPGALVAAGAAASIAGTGRWKVQKSPNPGRLEDYLNGVAAASRSDAWAVGEYASRRPRTLIEHWNGRSWKAQKSPNPGGGSRHEDYLEGVAAVSRRDAWAVGFYHHFSGFPGHVTLIEHWNGKEWRVQESPSRGFLNGAAATSRSDAWAVGDYNSCRRGKPVCRNTGTRQTLIEHWNGRSWKVQKSPNPVGPNPDGFADVLTGVAAASSSDAWAVGYYVNSTGSHALIEHWNGKTWTVQTSPNPSGGALYGAAAVSSSDAWAVGAYTGGTLVEHWNGRSWKVQKSPNHGGSSNNNGLFGVAATSSSDAWAVGDYYNVLGFRQTLIEHWNGTAWKVQTSRNPGGSSNDNLLPGVAAVSAKAVWAVGDYSTTRGPLTFVPLTLIEYRG
jgi:hypothetical protein